MQRLFCQWVCQISTKKNIKITNSALAKARPETYPIRRKFSTSLLKPDHTLNTYCQGWQYGAVRSEFAYYVPRTLNRTIPAYRTSAQFLKRTVSVS